VRALFKLLNTSDPNVEDVQVLIEEYPDVVKQKDATGALPLHAAIKKDASDEVVQLLFKAYPDAVKEKDGYGKLPLHHAVVHCAEEVIQLLIKEYPDAVKEKDINEYLPLYVAVRNDVSVEVIKLLIKEYPDALETNIGNLPLHAAIEWGASDEVIQLLVKEYPDALKEKDSSRELPLHRAIAFDWSVEVLQLLIKEYPDAVKANNKYGKLPLDNPQIKEIYDRVVNVVQKLARSKGLLGDHAKGKDLLGVKEEAQAIADTIAFKDLQPPFVVGILGGWGSGKSFTFNLIEEQLKEIQRFNLADEVIKLDFPYVGHIYLIKFDVWTFAKGCLWSSLMNRILTELNDQLDLEAAIGPELLMKGVSVIELIDQFTTRGEIEYMKETMKGESLKQAIREWKPSGGNITEALVNATNSNYKEEVKELAKKKQKLHCFLALEDIITEENTKILPEIKKLLKDAYEQYAEENREDPSPQSADAVISSMKQWKGLKRYWDLFRAGRLPPLWLTVFLSSLVIAVALPLVFEKTAAIATAIGPFVSGIVLKYNDARKKLMSAQAEIAKVAKEMRLDKEQVQKALEAADGAQLRSDTNDEEKQQDIIRDLNADINSLEDRVWLRKGDSLNKVIADRVGSNNYEEHLGVVHQAQADLKHISDAMLGSKQKDNFPRGDPRIVLFIDDLDRCPPKKVVETLEAVQLLVKTKLFVVVLAIDARYVTLCLENEYQNILSQKRNPSGLDYIEKIVQLPYRVPPISAEYMESYLQAQMNAEEDYTRELSAQNITQPPVQEKGSQSTVEGSDESKSPEPNNDDEQPDVKTPILSDNMTTGTTHNTTNEGVPEDTPMTETAQSVSKEPLVSIPTKVLKFTSNELQSLDNACVFSGVGPRSVKRIVNVFKLIKIIWLRRDQTPDEDTPHEVSMKDACVLILALCASNSRSVRREMCKVLAKIETATSRPVDCGNLKSFIRNTLGEIESEQVDDSPLTVIYDEKCSGIFEKVEWKDDEEWKLVKKDLRLVRSFSFVGEYNESVKVIDRGT